MKMSLLACLALSTLAACASELDGSGVDGDKRLLSTTADERAQLCDYVVELAGPERMVDCGELRPRNVGGLTREMCLDDLPTASDEPCVATVADYEACIEAVFADSCMDDDVVPPECALFTTDGCK